MKTIAIVLPDLSVIGAQKYIVGISKILEERGYKITYLLMNNCGELRNEIDSTKIISFESRRLKNIKTIRVLESLYRLYKELKYGDYAMVLSVTPFFNRVVALYKLLNLLQSKVLIEEHLYPPLWMSNRSEISKTAAIVYKRTYPLYRYADEIRVVSREATQYFKDYLKIDKNITFFPSLLDIQKVIYLAGLQTNIIFDKSRYNIVYFGRVVAQKNIAYLLECYANLCNEFKELNCHLWIIGDGELKNELMELADSLGLSEKTTFLGYVDNPYPVLKQGDAFVLTSIWEGSPQVMVEAMILKVPVVSVNCKTGPSEVIGLSSERGWLVEENNKPQFVSALKEALTDKREASKRTENAYNFIYENYDLERCINKYINLFLENR